jgi:hemoglobin/transferrin/lactoferrin receptor protein
MSQKRFRGSHCVTGTRKLALRAAFLNAMRPQSYLWLCLSPLTLLAADPSEPKTPEKELPELVITATRSGTDPLKVPAQVRTLDAEQLAERQVRTLPEALRETPGVNVQKTANGQGSPFIRGFTGFRNLALIDGIRFNNSTFRDGPNQYWNTIDSAAISRIELVPGQGSVLYGSDSIGGTVNLFTKDSGYLTEQPGFFFHGLTSYRGSTVDESNSVHQEIQAGEGGKWGLHLGASLRSFGDVHDAKLGDQAQTGYDEWAYDARLDIALDPNWTLTAVHQQLRQNDVWRTHATIYGISYEGTAIGTDLKRAYDQERSLSYLRLAGTDLDSFIDSVSFTVSLQTANEYEHRIRRRADNRVDYNQTQVTTLGFDLQFQTQTPFGRLTYGADYFHDSINSASQRYRLNGTFVSRAVQGPVGDNSSYDLLGLYLQDELDFADRVHLFVGGRYTYAKADVGRYDDRRTTQAVDSAEDTWKNFSASARVTLDLDEKDQYRLYAGVSQGFRAPNLSDLSRLDIARSGELEVPSTGLDPEQYVNFEIGLKADTEHFSGNLGYFYTLIDDMIIRHRTGEVIGGNRVVEKKNGGDGFMQGIELAGEYRFNPHWAVFGQVTWTEGRVKQYVGTSTTKQRIEPISRVVPLMWRAGVRWQTTDKRFWSELVALGQSDTDRLNTGDVLDNQRIPPDGNPGFVWLTLRGGVQVTKNLDLTLALENLLDRQIRYAGSGSNEGGFGAVVGATVKW